jgi:hypothetical protein
VKREWASFKLATIQPQHHLKERYGAVRCINVPSQAARFGAFHVRQVPLAGIPHMRPGYYAAGGNVLCPCGCFIR